MEKTCCVCSETKLVELFPKDSRAKDGLYPACKVCRKEIKRQSYLKNKEHIMQKQREKRRVVQKWVLQFKKKCELCPETHPGCLDFHHEGDKEFGIADMINRNNLNEASKRLILKEIKKCRVLCSNCHRKLHWEEINGPVV